MAGDKKVSIIIPLYNRKDMISRCVESVCRQTYRNLEIIVVDDGSTDGCDEVLESLKKSDERIIIIRKENGGVSSARNCGLDVATGDYVQFVDSDDAILPETIDENVSAMEKYNADCVVFHSVRGVPAGPCPDFVECRDLVGVVLKAQSIGAPWNKLFKRSLIANQRFDSVVSMGEDLIFNISYLRKCKSLSFVNKGLYLYTASDDGQALSKRYCERSFDDVRAQWKVMREYIESGCPADTETCLYRFLWACYINVIRKLCLRSGGGYGKIVKTIALWQCDEMVKDLPLSACPYAPEARALQNGHIWLVPLIIKAAHIKNVMMRRFRRFH